MCNLDLFCQIQFLIVNKPLPGLRVPAPIATDPRDVLRFAAMMQENVIIVREVIFCFVFRVM